MDYHDPYIDEIKIKKKIINSKSLNNLKNYDYVIICTNHSVIDYKKIYNISKKIIDTRGVYKNIDSTKVIHL